MQPPDGVFDPSAQSIRSLPQVLVKRCGPITALDDVSLMVREGEILGFPGISGAGKTTMIRLLIAVL